MRTKEILEVCRNRASLLSLVFRRAISNCLATMVVILLVGCVTAPTREQQASADYGDMPSNYEDVIKGHMSSMLKDPFSAEYVFGAIPMKQWAGGGLNGPIKYGWGTCFRLNSKNSFGAFTGYRKYYVLLRDASVIYLQDVQNLNSVSVCGF